jgi:hypothetical protein
MRCWRLERQADQRQARARCVSSSAPGNALMSIAASLFRS